MVLYRVLLGVLLVVALVLTLNERLQEQRSEQTPTALAASGVAPPRPPAGTVGGDAYPAPPPTLTPVPGADLAAYPVPAPTTPFVPHNVRLKADADLRSAPGEGAPPAQPISRLSAGATARATDHRGDWYLIDTGVTRGWVPAANVEDS